MMMGDVGALGSAARWASSRVLAKQELVLPIAGGIFVIEAGSVILQRYYYKATHRRIFRMAPLHHHFELGGWPETQVVVRFLDNFDHLRTGRAQHAQVALRIRAEGHGCF